MPQGLNMRMLECTQTVQCEMPVPGSEDPLVFRIEVLRDIKKKTIFKFRVTRLDSYRLKPSFPMGKGQSVADERFFIEDLFLWAEDTEITARSEQVALRKALRAIKTQLSKAYCSGGVRASP